MSERSEIPLCPPRDFDFRNTVFSHGWCSLAPFSVDEQPLTLRTILRLADGRSASVATVCDPGGYLMVTIGGVRSSNRIRAEIVHQLGMILHFTCDLSPFYHRVERHLEHRWMARKKAGRFLRGASFFEDVIKTILTTNCSWALTQAMTGNLAACCGSGLDTAAGAFPQPDAIAEAGERFLRERAKLGYRAPFVLELSRRCAKGELDIEAFRRSAAPARELYKELRTIKGIGDYAAGNLLRLLGRFEHLALDSWCRSKFSELHANGGQVADQDIERHYAPYEEWKGLVMWLDLTRYWYTKKFPL
jgi:3-methyladenine DNA glycosylase/8-oxoguanine DNA glycosylase